MAKNLINPVSAPITTPYGQPHSHKAMSCESNMAYSNSIDYHLKTENTADLLQLINNEMRKCPSDGIKLHFVEVVSASGINRRIEFKGKGGNQKTNKALADFKVNFFSTLSTTNEFMSIDESKVWNVKNGLSLNEAFTFPKTLYDINGNETTLSLSNSKVTLVLLWKDTASLKQVLLKLTQRGVDVIAISLNDNDFFKKKKYLMEEGLINKASYYFEDDKSNCAFDYSVDTWVMIVNQKGVIQFDREHKEMYKDNSAIIESIAKGNRIFDENERKKTQSNEWWLSLTNDAKREYLSIINQRIAEKDLKHLYFSISSEIVLSRRGGIHKYTTPQIIGFLPKTSKSLLDSFTKEIVSEGNLEDIQTSITYRD